MRAMLLRSLRTALELTTMREPRPGARQLLDKLAHAPGVRYLHRQANLEDLFIKLTGRELRD